MLGNQCSHGVKWQHKCPECDVIRAREIVRQWGDYVDESRMVIAEAEAVKTGAEATP
jgi:hypothetical protein